MGMNPEPFFDWVAERHAITLRKARLNGEELPAWADPAGALGDPSILPKLSGEHPLTDDPVMREYKLCSAFRELDRVTIWIREHIREPYADHETLWLMLAVARLLNWPPTLMEIMGAPGAWPGDDSWDPDRLTAALMERRTRGDQLETGAFMITANGIRKDRPWHGWSKQRYLAEAVIGQLWEHREGWGIFFEHPEPTLESAWQRLSEDYEGWGPFMSWQLVLEFREVRYLRNAPDRDTWAAVGPGSRRGLNRLHGRPVRYGLSQDQALEEMRELVTVSPEFLAPWVPPITVSDCQHELCETDKWLRVKGGEGRPRSRYRPFQGWPA